MFIISTTVPSLVLSADVALRKLSEERYKALFEEANDIVATLDLNMVFTSVNPAAERLLGYSRAELLGSALSSYVPAEQLGMHQTMLDRKLHGETATQYVMRFRAKDGRVAVLEVSSRLMLNRMGKVVGISRNRA